MSPRQISTTVKSSRFILKPAPAELPGQLRSEQDIARHRCLYCPHYDGCLNQSVREGWASFSCLHCPLRAAAATGPESAPFANQRRFERR